MSPFSRPARVVIVTSVVAWANFLIRACFGGHVSIPPLDAYPQSCLRPANMDSHGAVPHKNRMRHRSHGMVPRPELMCPDSHVSVQPSRSGGNRHLGCGMGQFPYPSVFLRPCLHSTTGRLSAVMAPSRYPVSRPAIPVLAVTRCAEYEKKVSLWDKKKMDNDLHDNTE